MRELAGLLETLAAVIRDHELKDRDPEAHKAALQDAFQAVRTRSKELEPQLDFRLNHFLTQHSYEKALDWIRTQYLNEPGEASGSA